MIQFAYYDLNFVWGALSFGIVYFIVSLMLIDSFTQTTPIIAFFIALFLMTIIYFALGLVFGGV